ncbi:MAG: AAA family ATPase [Desulfobulbaceae bacterium]|nr:AAA family ATPase [Desulfobulbaceae bacterium]
MLRSFEELRSRLKSIVYDQGSAVDEVVDAFVQMAYKPVEAPPRAFFTFLGPSGVGKCFLAEALTAHVDDLDGIKLFDMEQYADLEEGARLLGIPGGEAGQEGELPRFIRDNPGGVVIFDNIEKADNKLQLAILDLVSKRGAESILDCSALVVVFTSTMGGGLYKNGEFRRSFAENRPRGQGLLLDALAAEKKVVYEQIQPAIAPKLLAAMARSYVVLFNPLSLETMVRVGAESLRRFTDHFIKKSGITLRYPKFEPLATLLTLSFAPDMTMRRVRQKLPDLILDKITSSIRETDRPPTRISFAVSKAAADFLAALLRENGELLRRLFKNNETVELEWGRVRRDDRVTFTVRRAQVRRLPPAGDFVREEGPRIEYSGIGFDDIAGNSSVKQSLREIIAILRSPEKIQRFGIEMPKGVLLSGPSGVGKTMLGKAFAKEAGLPYVFVARGELFDPGYLRRVYQKAREYAPSIVFLDGMDVKGLVEGVVTPVPEDPLVMEIDAVSGDPNEFVFTIATANSRDDVGGALLESGRIDIFIEAPELDREARRFFIDKILEKPNDGRIDVEKVVRYLSGMSCHDLRRIGKEASLSAIRQGLDQITEEILIEQINIIKYGSKVEKKHIRNLEEDLKVTAYHEAGHAVLSYILLPEIKIEQVTIAPRLQTLGFTAYSTEDFIGNVTRQEVFNNICVLLAGRAANIKQFGERGIDSGAANDLEVATHQAYLAVANLGMDEELGNVQADTLCQHVSRQLFLRTVEKRVQVWISDASARAEKLVAEHWDKIERLATVLIRQEIVDGAELEAIMAEGGEAAE